MRIVFDLDGVICKIKSDDMCYKDCIPNNDVIQKINYFKKLWYTIIINTARNMKTQKSNLWKIIKNIWGDTIEWLNNNNVSYDELYFWKPLWDYYIDDNSIRFRTVKDLDLIEKKEILNIIIPMAWNSKRFKDWWYEIPKCYLFYDSKPLFYHSAETFNFLNKKYNIKYTFIILKEHKKYWWKEMIKSFYNDANIIELDNITKWQAKTCLSTVDLIPREEKLIIYNADSFCKITTDFTQLDCDWLIPVFKSSDKWLSYVNIEEDWNVVNVREKEVISDNASVWIYYFKKSKYFFDEYIQDNVNMSNWEYYVAPVYNNLINKWLKISTIFVDKYISIWTPSEYNKLIW